MAREKSYRQIIKSSYIMGGASGVNLLIGMVRVKFTALLIGSTGIGLLASLSAIQVLIGTLVSMGFQQSSIRAIAIASGKGDYLEIGRIVLTMRRITWLTGIVGMVVMFFLSPTLSRLTFGNENYSLEIAALGIVILLNNLCIGQNALMQGMRRIADMAIASLYVSVFAALAAIFFYNLMGIRGIVPTLIIISIFDLIVLLFFSRRLTVPKVILNWRQTLSKAGELINFGLVMMSNSLMASIVVFISIYLISNLEGINGVGLYSAAFALSGVFTNFILNAMAADFYPRLAEVSSDHPLVCKIVNEQTEVALLLAMPGLLFTMAMAPWILQFFYSEEFTSSLELLRWFLLGCLGRVISWPMGYVMLALGKSKWLICTEIVMHIIHLSLIYVSLKIFGLVGVSKSFTLLYIIHILIMLLICNKLISFLWSRQTLFIICISNVCITLLFILTFHLENLTIGVIGFLLSIMFFLLSILILSNRMNLKLREFLFNEAKKFFLKFK